MLKKKNIAEIYMENNLKKAKSSIYKNLTRFTILTTMEAMGI